MYLVLTKYGGIYLCESHSREPRSRWGVSLNNAHYIKKKNRISNFAHVSLEGKSVILIEKYNILVDEESPWLTYNRIYNHLKNKKFHIKTKFELTKWGADEWK